MDWQFAACANPLLDYGTLAYLSMEPETTEEQIDELPTTYHNTFTTVCAHLGIDAPWSREEFKSNAGAIPPVVYEIIGCAHLVLK